MVRRVFPLHVIKSYPIVFYGQNVADLIGADPKDIVFTSGATESNNMSIKGVARFNQEKKRHIITTQTVRRSLTSLLRLIWLKTF